MNRKRARTTNKRPKKRKGRRREITVWPKKSSSKGGGGPRKPLDSRNQNKKNRGKGGYYGRLKKILVTPGEREKTALGTKETTISTKKLKQMGEDNRGRGKYQQKDKGKKNIRRKGRAKKWVRGRKGVRLMVWEKRHQADQK